MVIFDGHSTHTHLELLKLARENSIVQVEIPSHCSHWLQQRARARARARERECFLVYFLISYMHISRGVYRAFKAAWHAECSNFTATIGMPPGKAQFFRTLTLAWVAGMKPGNIQSGFSACGLHPFRPAAVPEEAYQPSGINHIIIVLNSCDGWMDGCR